MKRLSDMTIRQRGRMLFWVYCIPIVYLLIQALALQLWWIVAVGLVAFAANVVFLLGSEKKTRDDPPHANY